MNTEKIERNGNRTQAESGKLSGDFCHFSVIRTLYLAQEFTQMCQRRANVIALNRCSVMEMRWNKNEV